MRLSFNAEVCTVNTRELVKDLVNVLYDVVSALHRCILKDNLIPITASCVLCGY